ncbi:MAG TPA: polyprenyl synthetase family protein [Candidatus Thermoplasmatota archaeon]|nr:polyprenyl synthetase family protein [Candidatus Thermoplasmatota archaeon]
MSHPVLEVFPPSVHADLERLETRLHEQAHSRDRRLQDWSREPLDAGGKRVRPLLLLTTFEACGGDLRGAEKRGQAVDAAVALELVHTASLVHDDIMDEAAERRGKPSTYAAHGRDGAILVGDYLFTQAFALAATLPKQAMQMTADACRRLCEGQMREDELRRSPLSLAPGSDPSAVQAARAAYTAVIRDKTAAAIAASCGLGATMAGADDDLVQAMYRYGDCIGHAFQVLDDVLDVAGDPAWTGKPAGTDYLASTWSSPYLNFVERGGSLPSTRQRDDFPGIRARLFESGAVAASQLEASTYTQAALLELQMLQPSPARAALEALAELLMERAA